MILKEVFGFAQKLSGAWQTTDKSLVWFFDAPEVDIYPNWKFHEKHESLDDFIEFDYLLYNPSNNIFRMRYSGALGLNEYKLKSREISFIMRVALVRG